MNIPEPEGDRDALPQQHFYPCQQRRLSCQIWEASLCIECAWWLSVRTGRQISRSQARRVESSVATTWSELPGKQTAESSFISFTLSSRSWYAKPTDGQIFKYYVRRQEFILDGFLSQAICFRGSDILMHTDLTLINLRMPLPPCANVVEHIQRNVFTSTTERSPRTYE